MSEIRDQIHHIVDQLTPQQLLTVRMFLEDCLAQTAAPQEPVAAPRPFSPFSAEDEPRRMRRVSLESYRREMGLVEPE